MHWHIVFSIFLAYACLFVSAIFSGLNFYTLLDNVDTANKVFRKNTPATTATIAGLSGCLFVVDLIIYWYAHAEQSEKETVDALLKVVGFLCFGLIVAAIANLIVSFFFEPSTVAVACPFAVVCAVVSCGMTCQYNVYSGSCLPPCPCEPNDTPECCSCCAVGGSQENQDTANGQVTHVFASGPC